MKSLRVWMVCLLVWHMRFWLIPSHLPFLSFLPRTVRSDLVYWQSHKHQTWGCIFALGRMARDLRTFFEVRFNFHKMKRDFMGCWGYSLSINCHQVHGNGADFLQCQDLRHPQSCSASPDLGLWGLPWRWMEHAPEGWEIEIETAGSYIHSWYV